MLAWNQSISLATVCWHWCTLLRFIARTTRERCFFTTFRGAAGRFWMPIVLLLFFHPIIFLTPADYIGPYILLSYSLYYSNYLHVRDQLIVYKTATTIELHCTSKSCCLYSSRSGIIARGTNTTTIIVHNPHQPRYLHTFLQIWSIDILMDGAISWVHAPTVNMMYLNYLTSVGLQRWRKHLHCNHAITTGRSVRVQAWMQGGVCYVSTRRVLWMIYNIVLGI